jgi:hypothetical protein
MRQYGARRNSPDDRPNGETSVGREKEGRLTRDALDHRGIDQRGKGTMVFFAAFMGALVGVDDGFVKLFTEDGPPKGWRVTEWNDVAKDAPNEARWTAANGVLKPGERRGTWLLSEREYADFVLEFEIKLSERGNSGVALRAPAFGDPAFDGMELQFADFRYNTAAKDSELTGGIYRAIAPTKQVYKPTEWNTCRIELGGGRLRATINGELVQDVDLSKFDKTVKRHDGTDAKPIKDRPRKGRIGFQHLSRNNEPIEIRNVRLKELNQPKAPELERYVGPAFSVLGPKGWDRESGGAENHRWVQWISKGVQIRVHDDSAGVADLIAGPDRGKKMADPELEVIHGIHLGKRASIEEDFENYKEDKPVPFDCILGMGRWSAFSGIQGAVVKTKTCGVRATVQSATQTVALRCLCQESQWGTFKPIFEKIVASVGPGRRR